VCAQRERERERETEAERQGATGMIHPHKFPFREHGDESWTTSNTEYMFGPSWDDYQWGCEVLLFLFLGYCNVTGRYAFVTYDDSHGRPHVVVCVPKLMALLKECHPDLLEDEDLDEDKLRSFFIDMFFGDGTEPESLLSDIRYAVPPIMKLRLLADLALQFDHAQLDDEFNRFTLIIPTSWVVACLRAVADIEGLRGVVTVDVRDYRPVKQATVATDIGYYPVMDEIDERGLGRDFEWFNKQTGRAAPVDDVVGISSRNRNFVVLQRQFHRVPVTEDVLKRHCYDTFRLIQTCRELFESLVDGLPPQQTSPTAHQVFYISVGRIGIVKGDINSHGIETEWTSEEDLRAWFGDPQKLHTWIGELEWQDKCGYVAARALLLRDLGLIQ
jgi:hypothetical protein